MANTPFKFLDSYTSDDRDIFFGREKEIQELFYKVFEGNLLIVYGSSGTGKTSLIQCGLAGKFEAADWMPILVRRSGNINDSLKKILQNLAIVPLSEKRSLSSNIKSVYLDYFKPIYLIFDQFEELFIFGSDDEIEKFITDLHDTLNAGLSCKFIFVIRGEYLENIARFEDKIPDFFNNRIRIERMTRNNAIRVISEPCKIFNISVADDFPGKVLERLGTGKATVELTYLQVYLDKLYKKAVTINAKQPEFNDNLLQQAGEIDDVLAEFLDEQIAKTKNPEDSLVILKSFVSAEGTKKQMSPHEVIDFTMALGKSLLLDTIEINLQQFVDLRILKDKDDNDKYELRHDALAGKIYEQISLGEKELLEVRQFLLNRFYDFQKRGALLEDSDLQYIAPYENKLFLNDEQKQFIERSKRAVRRKRNRQRNIGIGAGVGLILILSGFTLFALKQRDEAIAQTTIAQQKTQEALNQKELSEKSKEMAMSASQQALDAKSFAELQAKIAGEQKKIAEQQASKATEQTQFATTQQTLAEQQRLVAEQKSSEAQREKQKADSAQMEANRLRLLTLSQTIAFKSLQAKDDKQLSALLAYESYELNAKNGGNPQDPQLYSALYESSKDIASGYQPIVIRTKNEIKAMAISDNGQTVAVLNGDGSLSIYSGSDYALRNTEQVADGHAVFDQGFISPDLKFVIVGYDDNSATYYNIQSETSSPVLKGHTGLIRAAAFGDGNFFATGARDSTLILWSNNAVLKEIHFDARIRTMNMSADNSNIAVGCEDGQMFLLNISTAAKKLIGNSAARILCSALSLQGNDIAFGSSNSAVNLFRANGSLLKTIGDNNGSIDFLRIDENLKVLISVSNRKIINVYNLSDLTQKPISIKDISSSIVSLDLSADGKILVGCADNAIRQFDIITAHLQSLLYQNINRNFTVEEWDNFIGSDVPYKKIKSD